MNKKIKSSIPFSGLNESEVIESIYLRSKMIPKLITFVQDQVRNAASFINHQDINHIYLVGCGDSLFAGLAAKFSLEKYSGYRIEVVPALEFSRYTVDNLGKNSLVISISNSGSTTRPFESILEAKRKGITTLSIVGKPDTLMGNAADLSVIHNEAEFRGCPLSINGYHAITMVLNLLALELGKLSGNVSKSILKFAFDQFELISKQIPQTINENYELAMNYANLIAEKESCFVLGAGPNLATAFFITAKMFEQPQKLGVAVELEDWAHQQFFLARENTPFIVISPPGNSIDRAREQLVGTRMLGVRSAVICAINDIETSRMADYSFKISGDLAEEFTPFLYSIPGELISIFMCSVLKKKVHAFYSHLQREVNLKLIKESKLRRDTYE